MIIDNPYLRGYLFGALKEGPVLLAHLLKDMTNVQADTRLDPDRFTLREVVAHLADWETVYQDRFRSVLELSEPTLEDIDEGQRAIDRQYHLLDWREQLELFAVRRSETTSMVESLPSKDWARLGNRPEIGVLSLLELVQLLPLHDLYHLKQAREFLFGSLT
jgi:hypothetical protein